MRSFFDRLSYDLDYNIACDRLIFTEIARLPNSLLFLPFRNYCADKIKLIGALRNNPQQKPNSGVAFELELGWRR